jgi:hypothetical protein
MLVKFVGKGKYWTHTVFEVVLIIHNELCMAGVLMGCYELKYN